MRAAGGRAYDTWDAGHNSSARSASPRVASPRATSLQPRAAGPRPPGRRRGSGWPDAGRQVSAPEGRRRPRAQTDGAGARRIPESRLAVAPTRRSLGECEVVSGLCGVLFKTLGGFEVN